MRRREILKGGLALTVAGSASIGSAAAAEAEVLDPVERIHTCLRELVKAMQVIDPTIDRYGFDPEIGFAIVSHGMRRGHLVTGEYHDIDKHGRVGRADA